MIRISVAADVRETVRRLDWTQRQQLPFAAALALTRVGKRVEDGIKAAMRTQFDRPTQWTLRSTFVEPAKKTNLAVTVGIKDRAAAGNRLSSAEILRHQFAGGARREKALEQWLRRAGYLGANEYVVPGEGAKLDRHGNISRGQVQQILSQLRAGPDPAAYASTSKRSQRNVRRAGKIFWSRGGHLQRGAWQRYGLHLVRPLLIAVSVLSYARRIEIAAIARTAVAQYGQTEFDRAIAQALRTAR